MEHEEDSPQDDAVGALGVALFFAFVAAVLMVVATYATGRKLYGAADAEVTAQIVAQACIAQFAPGEFWYRHVHVYQCATAALDTNHILTSPLGAP